MKVTLIFPPATDPRSPHLALPSLAAVLRGSGVDTELLDADLEGMLALLAPDRVRAAGEQLRAKARTASRGRRASLEHAIGLTEMLPERVPDALAVFDDADRFHDPLEFRVARDTISDCLDVVSLAAPAALRYNIDPLDYRVDGVDIQQLVDLVAVTGDPRSNLFADFWENDLLPRLESRSPDLVGITITNRQQVIPGLTLARALRRRGHFVVLGGTVYSKFAAELGRLPEFFEHFADGVVVYEGETAITELVDRLQGDRDFSRVPNFLYLRGGQVHATRTHVEDVTALPTPDFSGLSLDSYLTPEPVLPILFGKGCYFNRCKFCDIPYINSISPRAYRVRSTERIVDDVLKLERRFGVRHFQFTDEALAPALLDRLATALEPHRDRGFRFVGYARLERTFTAELCQRIAAMGVTKLFFGLESGAQETIDHMDKRIRIDEVPAVLRNCRDAGIAFHLFSIVGFPEESEESAWKTYRFFADNADVIDAPGNSFDIHPFGLELRTRYADRAEDHGIIISPDALTKEFVIGVDEGWVNTRGLTQDDVHRLLRQFGLLLRRVYRRYHAGAQPLWPPFEEFALLYADRYTRAAFPYRTSLPPPSQSSRYRLRWSPSATVVSRPDGTVVVGSRHGRIRLPRTMYDRLDDQDAATAVGLLAGAEDPLVALHAREAINDYLGDGLLQLVPVPARKTVGKGQQ
ncbi:radical SAM protein [Streptomyces canus]|uniref:B12-binding domain-containing radical SAM protein n=1 Tax=Streptomyces canus TaxID=58343 RepID=UPI002E2C4AF0|nr:radical SAM protein [Streptomyces canus]